MVGSQVPLFLPCSRACNRLRPRRPDISISAKYSYPLFSTIGISDISNSYTKKNATLDVKSSQADSFIICISESFKRFDISRSHSKVNYSIKEIKEPSLKVPLRYSLIIMRGRHSQTRIFIYEHEAFIRPSHSQTPTSIHENGSLNLEAYAEALAFLAAICASV